MQGFARLLEHEYGEQLDDVGRSYVERILASVEQMQNLIEDLLTAGPVRAPLPQRRLIESREVCLQLAAEIKPQLDERGIELLLPSVPPPVYSVRTHLYQVLCNLLSNAVRHMGVVAHPSIRVDLRRADGGVELVVEDNGRGIEPAFQGSLFDGSFTCSCESNGLGLVIVKRIMEAHGGRISVSSAPGRGATFVAFFPDEG
jgi:signal transduction histidine kinase